MSDSSTSTGIFYLLGQTTVCLLIANYFRWHLRFKMWKSHNLVSINFSASLNSQYWSNYKGPTQSSVLSENAISEITPICTNSFWQKLLKIFVHFRFDKSVVQWAQCLSCVHTRESWARANPFLPWDFIKAFELRLGRFNVHRRSRGKP